MSDILKKVQESFRETKDQIAKLTTDLGTITDLEGELAQLSENLQKSASSLRQISRDHAKFIAYATDLNQNLETAVEGLITVDPKRLNEGIKNLVNHANNLEAQLEAGISGLEETQFKVDERSTNGLRELKNRLAALEKKVDEINSASQILLTQTKRSSARALYFFLFLSACQIAGLFIATYWLK